MIRLKVCRMLSSIDCLLFSFFHLVVQQVSVCINLCNDGYQFLLLMFCFCVHECLWCRCFVRGARQKVEGRGVHVEIKQKGQNVIFDLFPCTISLSLYIFSRGVIRTAPWSPTYTTTTAPLRRRGYGCPFHPPLSARPPPALAVVSWPVTLAGGRKAAERQRDAAAMCEGRRGGSPDLSEWRRPAREMYTLPLLLLLLYSYIVTFLPISSSTEHTHSHARARAHDVDDFHC